MQIKVYNKILFVLSLDLFPFSRVFVGSGKPTFGTDPDPGICYGSEFATLGWAQIKGNNTVCMYAGPPLL